MLTPDELVLFEADLGWVWANKRILSEKDLEFVEDLRQALKEYGQWIHVTEKQRNYLRYLERKVSSV
jgi:GT2 family glycosyltransferase